MKPRLEAEKPLCCGGTWGQLFTGEDGQISRVSAAMWPTNKIPLFKQAAQEMGISVDILAQSGEPSPKRYGGYLVSPDRTFAEITFTSEDAIPFWSRVAELEALLISNQ